MLAKITRNEKEVLAHFERQLNHTKESVWSMLTDNDQLEKWFQELRVGELRNGGFMKFYMEDVMDEKLEITEVETFSILEFDWFGDEIRFELHEDPNGCVLILRETINKVTEQTKKDLAGWHVCLDVIQALLDGKTIQREKEWEKRYVEYAKIVDELATSNNK
jgi:uncharacterized protein YndB with AHSA1/START domain